MTNSAITIGIASTQAAVTALSAFTLSIQRAYLHKTKENPNLRFDTKCKSAETDDSSHLNRLSIDTFGLMALSVYEFYREIDHPTSWYHQASSCVQLIAWLYTSVIVMVANKHTLPSTWGWNLNIHLFLLYLVAWVISIYNFYAATVSNPNDTMLHLLPSLLYLIFTSDLLYTSGTRPRGIQHLDENDKPVIAVEVASIFSFLYFNWATPLVHLAYQNQTLTDKDLPSLPALFRGYNLFYIFGETKQAKSLLKRLYYANRRPIWIQVIMALLSSMFYYLPAYFVNQLLLLIQAMNGQEDATMIRQGFVLVIGLGVTIFVLGLITGQLWYFGKA